MLYGNNLHRAAPCYHHSWSQVQLSKIPIELRVKPDMSVVRTHNISCSRRVNQTISMCLFAIWGQHGEITVFKLQLTKHIYIHVGKSRQQQLGQAMGPPTQRLTSFNVWPCGGMDGGTAKCCTTTARGLCAAIGGVTLRTEEFMKCRGYMRWVSPCFQHTRTQPINTDYSYNSHTGFRNKCYKQVWSNICAWSSLRPTKGEAVWHDDMPYAQCVHHVMWWWCSIRQRHVKP